MSERETGTCYFSESAGSMGGEGISLRVRKGERGVDQIGLPRVAKWFLGRFLSEIKNVPVVFL